MCDEVMVCLPTGNVFANTKAELRAALGIEPVREGLYGDWPNECCLCPCDLEATAKAANMSLISHGCMEHTMTPNVEFSERSAAGAKSAGTQSYTDTKRKP